MAKETIPQEILESRILVFKGYKVMLDRDLAVLYRVGTKALNRAVRQNMDRFPGDFMFKLKKSEANELSRCQFGTLKRGGNVKYAPYVFTENGVAMLSSVLHSKRAVAVNIQIMRTFTKLRELLNTHADLRRKMEEMEKKYDYQFKVIFDAIKRLISTPDEPVKKIGFTGANRALRGIIIWINPVLLRPLLRKSL